MVKSKQTKIEQAAILRWQQETAQKRMEDLLTSTYNDGTKVDGVLSPYDGISRGIITALQNAGYGARRAQEDAGRHRAGRRDRLGEADQDGVQNSTIFKDTRNAGRAGRTAAKAFLKGNQPEANDTKTYDNGVKVVPSYLLPVVTVYKDDIQKELVDTGYWTADEVAAGQAK